MNLLDPQARKYYQNYGPKFQINGQGFFTTEFLKKNKRESMVSYRKSWIGNSDHFDGQGNVRSVTDTSGKLETRGNLNIQG